MQITESSGRMVFILLILFLGSTLQFCKNPSTSKEGEKEKVVVSPRVKPAVVGAPRILFIGNSHTEYYISLPQLFNELCAFNKKDMIVDTLVEMGEPLEYFYTDIKDRLESKLNKTDTDSNYYDYVVLQEKTDVAADDLPAYKEAVEIIMQKVRKNSPDAILLVYELMSPFNYDKEHSSFDEWYNAIKKNVAEVVKQNSNSKVYHVGSAIKQAYENKNGYQHIAAGNDLLRYGVQNLHMLNDGGFLAAALLYQTLFNEQPAVPEKMTFSTGTEDNDGLELLPVRNKISNVEALLKIAGENK